MQTTKGSRDNPQQPGSQDNPRCNIQSHVEGTGPLASWP